MRLIEPRFEIIEQQSGLEGVYKQIEIAGRVSHKSEDKITENSSKEFVDRMIKLQHGATLEFGTVYLKNLVNPSKYENNKFSKVNRVEYAKVGKGIYETRLKNWFITTNYRVLTENGWLDDLKYLCEPTEYHEKRITVKFICDRGILAEFTRHRAFSFMAESTRYCNYSRDKFGNELTFIKPCWLNIPTGQYSYWDGDWCDINNLKIQLPEGEYKDIDAFLWTLHNTELQYKLLINSGWKPQEARTILPNSLKTELVMTGFVSDWKHFFKLRTSIIAETGKPHPDASALADPLYKEFIERGYMESL